MDQELRHHTLQLDYELLDRAPLRYVLSLEPDEVVRFGLKTTVFHHQSRVQ